MSKKIRFIRTLSLVTAPVMMLLVGAGAASAAPKVIPFILPSSGTFISQGAPIDTDGDGKQAHLILLQGVHPRFGKVTIQGVGEFDQTNMAGVCPNGNPGVEQNLVAGAIVVRLKTGATIRSKVSSGNACLDGLTKHMVYVTFNSRITGGTGAFSGATGNLKTTATATILVGDPLQEQGFGSVEARSAGRIITR